MTKNKKTLKIITIQSLVFMGLLFVLSIVLRALFIAHFKGELSGTNADEIAHFGLNFLRYDGQIIGVLSVIFFVLNFIPKQAFIKLYTLLVILITAFVGVANIGFYEIYDDTFNGALLGLVFDDKKAIWDMAFSGDFGFSGKILLWLALSLAFYALFALFYSKIVKIQGKKFRAPLFIGFALACLFAINGQIGLKGISLSKEIVPVSNAFLRKITHGGFRDLLYVYRSYAKIASSSFADFTNEPPLAATRAFFGLADNNESEFDLKKLLQKEVQNPSHTQINHIFYIIAESFSAWHFDEKFDEIGLTSELKALISEKNAFKADIFLQNAARTIDSLDMQISGLYHTGIPLSLSVGKSPIFEMSPGFIFSGLGYATRFFYGGSSTWYKMDAYTKSQGFEGIRGSTDIVKFASENALPPPFENSWGALDHYLYEFIKHYTLANKDIKSFSMIVSTSNHPPYDIEVEKFGISYDKINAFIKKHPEIPQKDINAKILAHISYQDKMLAHFVRTMAKALPDSLFVITGDHKGTSFFQAARGEVPLIVYSPSLQPIIRSKIGSHIDITPTIAELVAPNAYKYISFGEPLLSNAEKNGLSLNLGFDKNASQSRFALGLNAVANENFVYDGFKIEYFQGKNAKIQGKNVNLQSESANSNDESLAKAAFDQLKRARALSWWVIRNGYIVKE